MVMHWERERIMEKYSSTQLLMGTRIAEPTCQKALFWAFPLFAFFGQVAYNIEVDRISLHELRSLVQNKYLPMLDRRIMIMI